VSDGGAVHNGSRGQRVRDIQQAARRWQIARCCGSMPVTLCCCVCTLGATFCVGTYFVKQQPGLFQNFVHGNMYWCQTTRGTYYLMNAKDKLFFAKYESQEGANDVVNLTPLGDVCCVYNVGKAVLFEEYRLVPKGEPQSAKPAQAATSNADPDAVADKKEKKDKKKKKKSSSSSDRILR
jgi:hypothetical protein